MFSLRETAANAIFEFGVKQIMKKLLSYFPLFLFLLLAGCAGNQAIVNNIDEREANEIVVFLASKGISAQKIAATSSAVGATNTADMYNIAVGANQATDAMALLNRYGLPRRKGTNLLTLFAGGGLMSSDKEETIRYQAGLAEELKNTIRKIDGVLDADVQLSFPPAELTPTPGAPTPKTTAAVYVKHQGIMEDPNSHMEVKIKRLLAGSVNGLNFEDVSVISDRARLSDISLQGSSEMIGAQSLQDTYVSIWGLVITKSSLARFRFIFFSFILLLLAFAGAFGWAIYKYYPVIKKAQEAKTSQDETPPPGPNI
jgi:type III secretion protein J